MDARAGESTSCICLDDQLKIRGCRETIPTGLQNMEIEPSHRGRQKPRLCTNRKDKAPQRENHSKAGLRVHPSLWRERFGPITLIHVGWEAREAPVDAEVFFLDFSFYRTYQEVGFRVCDHPGFAE
jgi:hypothetical protein